jgi:hypothetical protein
MPRGVEHSRVAVYIRVSTDELPVVAVMPRGVEHAALDSERPHAVVPVVAVMPRGVEHAATMRRKNVQFVPSSL